MSKRLIVGAAAAVLLLQTSVAAFAASTASPSSHDRRAGDYFTTVTDNDIRRCTMADSEFHQVARGPQRAAITADTKGLHQEGVALCRGGADLQGIAKQELALKQSGVTPGIF